MAETHHHTHHTALSQGGGCVHALRSSTQDPGPCQAPELPAPPHPTPAQLGSLPGGFPPLHGWLPSIKAPLLGAEND